MSVSYEIFLYFDLKPAFRLIVKYLPADFDHLAVLLQNGENKHTICSGTKACVIGFLAVYPSAVAFCFCVLVPICLLAVIQIGANKPTISLQAESLKLKQA
ncbi:hypothetical protein KBT16_08100 [Nostoc sp. CCCryo 231-06]|nr:hypothetical protein [Nostoc sp. CCCryo 231-06]